MRQVNPIPLLYDAAVGEASWEDAVSAVSDALGAATFILGVGDPRAPATLEYWSRGYMSRVLRLTLLARDIVEAVLDGRQSEGMLLEDLLDGFSLESGVSNATILAGSVRSMIGRWHAPGSTRGFLLVETDDLTALAEHAAEWSDVLAAEVTPVLDDAEAGAAITKGKS
jgi:hypothetical protein